MLAIGSKAPTTKVLTDENKEVSLQDYEGSYVVLYAYPKDNTPGCTTQACSFRDESSAITDSGAVILGISADSVASHQKFKQKHNLPFTLLSDESHTLLEELGVWQQKTSFGTTRMGIVRTTFIFDKEGKLIHIYPKVSVQTHGKEIAEYLSTL
jgi:peroxiredoxin Q/BCP